MNGQYLLPANSKKSQLIFGLFTPKDLIVILIGGFLTVLLLLVLKNPTIGELIIAILPIITAASLVFPLAHYHNIMQFLINLFGFLLGTKKYYWRGWCVKDESRE